MELRFADLLEVPPQRAAKLNEILDRLTRARRAVLITHINSDPDGIGSQAAVAAWLEARGVEVCVVNPGPVPAEIKFLFHRRGLVVDRRKPRVPTLLASADVALVLDTAPADRIAPLNEHLRPEQTVVIDHHPAGRDDVGTQRLQDPTAAATGELVYDLISLSGDDWPAESVLGAYVALASDTGNFRYSNTTPRCHAVAADLIMRGADPEMVYQRLHATVPIRRLHLLREALDRLQLDEKAGIAWTLIPGSVQAAMNLKREDFDGIIDHVRSIEGTRVAMVFRETEDGQTKISFRSNGTTDVNMIAREFGGGGHAKASGATVPGLPDVVVDQVLEVVRRGV